MQITKAITSVVGLDKIAHFSTNFVAADIIIHAAGEVNLAALGVLVAVGILKEAFDDNTPAEHARDVLANTSGIALAITVATLL